uniref:Tyr recombinase domain-containing protein n=1 Tax=Photinus pyralis TaxID=7054 RepID=A0A1Y1MFY3_PHOPY
MMKSLSQATLAQYSVTYRVWWEYCISNFFNPYDGNILNVLSFFQHLLNTSTINYGSFNSHRAALSLILPGDIGKDIYLKRFLKGVFRLRPTKPKYDEIWDADVVLNFFRAALNSDLKAVSVKLISLLTLATGQRLQTLSLIKCSNIHQSNTGLKIYIPDLIKTSGPNRSQPILILPFFKEDQNLCVASVLLHYLDLTKELRTFDSELLFITTVKPYKPASKQTLSRWVKEGLKAAGVDTNIYKSHSTRHAATSSALRKGASFDVIKKAAGWSERSTVFQKFYNRPLVTSSNFLESVFKL